MLPHARILLPQSAQAGTHLDQPDERVEEPHYHTGGSRRDDLCVVTFILRIIGWPTSLVPASVLEPQSADSYFRVSISLDTRPCS